MSLADEVRQAIAEARLRCGRVIVVTVEGLGYTIVPTPLVEVFLRQLERSDAGEKKDAGEK